MSYTEEVVVEELNETSGELINVTKNETRYHMVSNPLIPLFVPNQCAAINATVKVRVVMSLANTSLLWFSNASANAHVTAVTVQRTSVFPLPVAPYSLSFYDSAGIIVVYQNVSASAEVPLHNATTFHWQIVQKGRSSGGVDCGLSNNRQMGNSTVISKIDGKTRVIEWYPTCVMRAILTANTTYHGADPYYAFDPVTIEARQCYISISYPSVVYLGAVADYMNVTAPSDTPNNMSLTSVAIASIPAAVTITPANIVFSRTQLSSRFNVVGNRLEPVNTLSANFTGYPSRCLARNDGPLSYRIANRTFLTAKLQVSQYYFSDANVTFDISTPSMLAAEVVVGCVAPIATISYAVLSPDTAFTSKLICQSATNGTIDFKFEVVQSRTLSWRQYAISPASIRLPNVQQPIGLRVTMFQPAVLLFGEQSGSDSQNTMYLTPTRGSDISETLVVTLSPTFALGVTPATLTWGAGESARKAVVVRSLDAFPNGTITISIASFDRGGNPTQETAGNRVTPDRQIVISINTKAPVFASWVPDWGVLTEGRALRVMYSVASPPIGGDLRITPIGPALRYLSISPPVLIINETMVAYATVMPLRPTTDEPSSVLLNVSFSGDAAVQFIIGATTQLDVEVRPRLRIESSMQQTHLSNGAESFQFYLEEPPLPNTYLTVTLACLLGGISQMIFAPSLITFTADSNPFVTVRSMAVFGTGAAGVNCTGVLGGNATGYAPFLRNIIIRDPQPIIFTFPAGKSFPDEAVSISINTQFAVAAPILVRVSCHWVPDPSAAVPVAGGPRYDDPLAGEEDLYSCARYVLDPIVSIPAHAINKIISFARVAVPSDIDAARSATITMRLETSTTDVVLPEGNMTQGTILMRPRRWVHILGLPSVVFEGDATVVSVEVESVPDGTEKLYVKIDGNPSVEFDRSSSRVKNITLMVPPAGGNLLVNISATTAAQANRYIAAVSVLHINLHPKITITASTAGGPQVLGEENAQSVSVVFSRSPILMRCQVRPLFTSPVGSLVAFLPPTLVWETSPLPDGGPAVTKQFSVIGLTPGMASELYFAPECEPREIESRSRRVVFSNNFELIPLKGIHLAAASANLTRVIAGALNGATLFVQLSSPPSGRSRLVIAFTFSNPLLARIEPPTLVMTSGMGQAVVSLIGLSQGEGAVIATVVEGSEYARHATGFSAITIIDTISVLVYLKGASASNYTSVPSDIWSEWEISVSDFVPDFHPSFLISAEVVSDGAVTPRPIGQSQPNAVTLVNLSTSSITISSPPVTHTFRIAAASFTPATVILSVQAPNRPEFRVTNTFHIGVVPLPDLNISGVPSTLAMGIRNARVALIGLFLPPLDVFDAVIDLTHCNASIASVVPLSPLAWTPEVHGAVGVSFAGWREGKCDILISKVSSIFGTQIVYLRRTITVTMPPSVDAVNSTNSVQALRNVVSSLDSIIGSVSGGGSSTQKQYYTGAGRGENITFLFQTIRTESGTVGVTSSNGSFPLSPVRQLTIKVVNEGSGSLERAGADIIILCSDPKPGEVGFAEAVAEGTAMVSVSVVSSHYLQITFGPMSGLLIVSDQSLLVSFEASAFDENAYPVDGRGSFPVILQRYQPNIVGPVVSYALQGVGHLSVLAAAFGAPTGAMTGMQFYQLTWLYDCPQHDTRRLALPYSIEIDRYAGGVDYAVVASSIFVGFAAVFAGMQLIVVAGFYIQRSETSSRTFFEIAGRFMFPGVTFMAIYFVSQLAVHYAFLGVFTSDVVGHRVAAFILVGVPALSLGVVIHGVVWRGKSLTFLPSEVVFREKNEKERKKALAQRRIINAGADGAGSENISLFSRIKDGFKPKGYWVHPTDASYVRRWGILFLDASGSYRWISLVYYASSILLGALSGFQPSTNAGCVGRTAAMAAVYGLMTLAIFFWRPYTYGFMNVSFFVIHALQLVAVSIIAAEARNDVRNDTLQKGALFTLTAASAMLLIALLVRAIIGSVVKAPSRADLLRICESNGVSTSALDLSVAHLRGDDGMAVLGAADDSSSASGDTDSVTETGTITAEASLAASQSAALQKPLLAAPPLLDSPLEGLADEDPSLFASGFPHHEDADLYGQYAPVYVTEQLRGTEHAFSPMKRAEIGRRQAAARRHFEDEGGGDGRHMWLSDVVARSGRGPLPSWSQPSTTTGRPYYSPDGDDGDGMGGSSFEMREHFATSAPRGGRGGATVGSPKSAPYSRVVEKPYAQHSRGR